MARINGYPESVQPGLPKLSKLPDGWEQAPLEKYLEEVRRPAKLVDDDRYRLVTVRRARGGVIEREYLRGKDIKVKSQFGILAGDFLISKRQIVHGACGLVPQELEGTIVSNEYAVLRSSDAFHLPFLGYLAESIYFQQTCFHSSIGVHIEKMLFKLDHWLKWKFNIPPLCEQRRIVDLLSTWDQAIDVCDKLIVNSEKRKQALMQKLLSGEHSSPESGAGVPVRTLKSVAEFIRDGTHGTHERVDDGIPLLSAVNVLSSGLIEFNDAPMITSSDYQKIHAKYEIEENDVLITVVGTLGRVAVVPKCKKFTVQRSVAIVRPGPKVDSRYLAHLARSFGFQHQLKKRANITAQPGVYLGELAKIQIPVPGVEDQKRIARVLDHAEQACLYQTKVKAILRAQRTALMQQLLTGRLRMKTEELTASEATIGRLR